MSVGLIGNQTEDPVDALDKAKSGERVVFYVVDIYEKGSGNNDELLSNMFDTLHENQATSGEALKAS